MQTRPLDVSPKDRSTAFFLFGFLLACYLLTFTGLVDSSDGLSMFATTESFVRTGSFDSNQLLWMGNQQGNIGVGGDLFSRKGYGMVLLAMPLVWLAKQWGAVGTGACGAAAQPFGYRLDGCAAVSHRAPLRLVAADVDRHGPALWPGNHGLALYAGVL